MEVLIARERLPDEAGADLAAIDCDAAAVRLAVEQGLPNAGDGERVGDRGDQQQAGACERDADRVTLGKSSPWANTALLSAPVADRDEGEMSVVIDRPTLTVLFDGVVVLTYDLNQLTQAEQDYFLSQTRFGLESDNDNQTRFESFRIETLP